MLAVSLFNHKTGMSFQIIIRLYLQEKQLLRISTEWHVHMSDLNLYGVLRNNFLYTLYQRSKVCLSSPAVCSASASCAQPWQSSLMMEHFILLLYETVLYCQHFRSWLERADPSAGTHKSIYTLLQVSEWLNCCYFLLNDQSLLQGA